MKNRFQLLSSELDDYRLDFKKKKRKRGGIKKTNPIIKTKMSEEKSVMMSTNNISDNEFVLNILEFFFNERLQERELNTALKELAANMLWTATKASKNMHLVPRPSLGVPSITWLISEGVKIINRNLNKKGIYEAVRKVVALKWRTAYELARMGISPGKMSAANSYQNETGSVKNISGQMSLAEIKSLVQSVQFSSNIPLDPVTGGMSIGESALMIGDIILSTTNHIISKGIRKMTNSPVSHAMIYIGDGHVVEAIGAGVVKRTLQNALKGATLAVAFGYLNMTVAQSNKIKNFALSKLGKKYDKMGIVRQAQFQVRKKSCSLIKNNMLKNKCLNWAGKINLGTSTNDEFFCSELVLEAYKNAGIPLTSTPPSWNTPDDIAELRLGKKLEYVGHLIV